MLYLLHNMQDQPLPSLDPGSININQILNFTVKKGNVFFKGN